jgi:porphobilinogen synthase
MNQKFALDLARRPRRNRKSATVRDLVRETELSVKDFVYPVFIMEGSNKEEAIPSMPGMTRKTVDVLLKELEECVALGIKAIAPSHRLKNPKRITRVPKVTIRTDLSRPAFAPLRKSSRIWLS